MAKERHWIPNPTGKGGFKDNPSHISGGRWNSETSIPYLQNKFGRMTLNEFLSYEPQTPFEKAAYESVKKSYEDLGYLKEVTDRTVGKPAQYIEQKQTNANIDLSGLTTDEIKNLLNEE
jgi:hypothetical protein